MNAQQIEQLVTTVLGIANQHDLANHIRKGTSLYRVLSHREPELLRSVRLMANLSNDTFKQKLTSENVIQAIVNRRPELEKTLRSPHGARWVALNLKEIKKALNL